MLIILKKHKRLFIIGLMLVLLGNFLFSAVRVNAQGETRLSIQPVSVDAILGSTTTLTVAVSNGSDLSGYDLIIAYDSAVVSLEYWTHGTYLSNLSVIHQQNEPGRLRLAAVQLASPGVSGDGTLITLKFRGSVLGRSAIIIEHAELATANSELVIPGVDDGEIRIIQATLPTATSTTVPLPKLTPTGIVSTSASSQTPPTNQAAQTITAVPATPESIGLPNRKTSTASSTLSTEQAGTVTATNPGAAAENSTLATQSPDSGKAGQTSEGRQPSRNLALVNILLWALVILLLAALIGIAVLHFTRRKKNGL